MRAVQVPCYLPAPLSSLEQTAALRRKKRGATRAQQQTYRQQTDRNKSGTHSGHSLIVGSVGDRLLWAVTLPLLLRLLLLVLTDLDWTDLGSND